MTIWQDTINALPPLRAGLREAAKRYDKATRPRVTDLHLTNVVAIEVQGWCRDHPAVAGDYPILATATLLAYCAPAALAGGRLGPNLRQRLARAACLTPSYISKNKGRVLFFASTYRSLREALDGIAEAVDARLAIEAKRKAQIPAIRTGWARQ